MSLKAILWALEDAPVDDPASALILVALADRASDDGTAAFPSHEWLAQRGRCSKSTVKRRLGRLESAGVIERGDQALLESSRIPSDRRPVVWNLNLALRGVRLSGGSTGTNDRSTGINDRSTGTSDRSAVTYKPSLTSPEPSLTVLANFEAWWEEFPTGHRTTGKSVKSMSKKRFSEALKHVDFDSLMEATRAYRSERDLEVSRDAKAREVTCNAQNWLRDHKWEPYVSSPADRLAECERFVASQDWVSLMAVLGVKVSPPDFGDIAPVEETARRAGWWRSWWESEGKKLV